MAIEVAKKRLELVMAELHEGLRKADEERRRATPQSSADAWIAGRLEVLAREALVDLQRAWAEISNAEQAAALAEREGK